MKSYKISPLLIALFLVWGMGDIGAQYDDLYYNPDTDGAYYDYGNSFNDGNASNSNRNNDEYYDDEYYDYEYSSRIRRFHRPYHGFGFFDPVYVDYAYFDPFFNPATTLLIYDSPWRWNRWNR